MTKAELLNEITALAGRLNRNLTERDGFTIAAVMFFDWFAAHPQEVDMAEIVDSWNAGR